MSLGAIDFGIVVDGAVIVVEAVMAAMHGKARMPSVERDEVVARSAGAIYQSPPLASSSFSSCLFRFFRLPESRAKCFALWPKP